MAEKAPTVSVIIPTYNRAHLVDRAIRSVLAQTYQDFEVIVVDDGSTDNTEEVVKGFDDSRIRYIHHEQNRGGSAARNTGIRAACGEYIAFLDSDDEWLPEKLTEQMRIFHEEQTCGAVYTKLLYVCPDENIELPQSHGPEGWILKHLLVSNVVGTTSSVIVKRECFEKVGVFDVTLRSCQDWDMWIRIAEYYTFRRIRRPLVRYTWHQEQISSHLEAVCQGHLAILKKYEADIRQLGRHVEAYHYFRLGNYLCHAGETWRGRKHLFGAMVRCPWHLKYGAYAFASLLRASGYRRLAKVKQSFMRALSIFIRDDQDRSHACKLMFYRDKMHQGGPKTHD